MVFSPQPLFLYFEVHKFHKQAKAFAFLGAATMSNKTKTKFNYFLAKSNWRIVAIRTFCGSFRLSQERELGHITSDIGTVIFCGAFARSDILSVDRRTISASPTTTEDSSSTRTHLD
jgi:hypothetical protein